MAERRLDKTCSDSHLARIADSIVDWRAVSPYLDLTEAEENAILGSSPHSVPAQKIAMLRKWKQKRGAKATYKKLCNALHERSDLVEKIKSTLTENNSSSEDEESQGDLCEYFERVVISICSL